ncbi:TPA: hypothetical protein PXF07_001545 [Mannheimia haemolytica]|uniref:Uncharacterized protein n=7 Tax=root TaxID=1 RepID=R9QBV7_9CAUD|nr:hypothetical protein [Mannheimia haemolytica]YP_655509.1 hypothetical protein MhaA1p42 [Mannheimia phage PHL101]ABD90643.1 hypothetical protein [Mannheimia phage phiMhaA1-BAA410]AFL46491.1 hypothetical protein 1152AP_0044 [Mannheimia phage vB_MhM_1152AP]AJA72915.1 hypothetical protein 535AP1_42 [Mannheimia phage vB_MhM_535AP1]AJA73147.1 hypothetical protein 2256AP1_43 [Mannheimia phage vB_MhM_2256AP1]AWW71380.1 hypothetical protein C4O86_06110 [Pasteurellaceae bacterium 12565]
MSQITKSAYTHIHPNWQAPRGNTYRIERYELKRRYALFCNGERVVLYKDPTHPNKNVESHIESDVLLLWLLKNELGWSGNIKEPLSPQDVENIRLLEQAFCLTYNGTFIK